MVAIQVATEREGLISGGVGGRDLVIGSRPYHRQGDDVNLRNLNIQNAYEQEDHLPDDPNYDKLIERKKIVARYETKQKYIEFISIFVQTIPISIKMHEI